MAADADERFPGAADCTSSDSKPTTDAPRYIVLDGPNWSMAKQSHQKQFGPRGFMTLQFQPPQSSACVSRTDRKHCRHDRLTSRRRGSRADRLPRPPS